MTANTAQRVDVERLRALIATYWDLAYAEGVEGRTHDTCNADAAACWSEIDALLLQVAEQAESLEIVRGLHRAACRELGLANKRTIAAERAREEAVALVARVVNDTYWRTNDNTLWPDLIAFLAANGGCNG